MNQDWTLQGLFEGQHEPSGGGLELYQTFRSESDQKAIREYTKNYIIRKGRHLFESMVEILEKDLASMNDIDRRIEFIKDFNKIAAWRRGDLRQHQLFGFTNSPYGPNTYWEILGLCDYPAEFILDSMKCLDMLKRNKYPIWIKRKMECWDPPYVLAEALMHYHDYLEKHELQQKSFAKKEKQSAQNELDQRYSIIEASIIAYKIMDKNILNHVEKLSKEHGLAEQSFKNKNRELSDLNTPHNTAKLRREPLNNWVGAKEHILNFEQHKERYKVNFKILLAYYDDQKYSDYMQFYQNL